MPKKEKRPSDSVPFVATYDPQNTNSNGAVILPTLLHALIQKGIFTQEEAEAIGRFGFRSTTLDESIQQYNEWQLKEAFFADKGWFYAKRLDANRVRHSYDFEYTDQLFDEWKKEKSFD